MSQDASASTGIRCPKCNCGHCPPYKTLAVPYGVRRYHVCRNCATRFSSTQRVRPVRGKDTEADENHTTSGNMDGASADFAQ